MKNPEFWKPIFASLAVTPFAWFVAFASAGFGHGNFLGAKILFPYPFIVPMLLPDTVLGALVSYLVLALSIVQFPLYGLALSLAVTRERLRALPVGLGLAHIVGATLCILFTPAW